MNGLQSIEAILEAIAALPEPARQRLASEMRRRGYLDSAARSRRPTAPPVATKPATPKIATRGAPMPEYQLQFGEGPDNLLSAMVAGWEECKSFGRDRREAIQNLICLIGAQAANGDIITLQPAVAGPTEAAPAAAPQRDYQQVLRYLENYQHQLVAAPLSEAAPEE